MEIKQPFFARFLESQKAETAAPGSRLEEAKNQPVTTLAFPSDQIDTCHQPKLPERLYPNCGDHAPGQSNPVTLKFPSDNEDGGDWCGEPNRLGPAGSLIDKDARDPAEPQSPGPLGSVIDPNAPKEPSRPRDIIGDLIKKQN